MKTRISAWDGERADVWDRCLTSAELQQEKQLKNLSDRYGTVTGGLPCTVWTMGYRLR
jgi:hypothetical protein